MNDLTRAFLADTGNIARERIEQIFEERMTALTAGVQQAVAESLAGAQRELAGKLNQAVRRLRCFDDHEQWGHTLVEATQGFCDRAALFAVNRGFLHLQATRNHAGVALGEDVPLHAAPAFASAVESKDTVVAMRTKGEMSAPIASLLGEAPSQKFHLFPIVTRAGVAALLYADADGRSIESNALELLATVAGAVVEGRNSPAEPISELVNIASVGHDLHSRAQRFARVHVAEIRLYKSEEVKNGRAARDVYTSLKVEIDSAREVFHRDFLSAPGTMVDYLHQELVRTLANDDAELLGPNYPGPLV
jgi:hypothetical protein